MQNQPFKNSLKNLLLKSITLMCVVVSSCKTKQTTATETVENNYIPYYLKVYEADSLFLTDNYQKSYEILDSLFQKFEPVNMQNFNEFGIYIASSTMIGKTDNLDANIRKAILEYGGIGFSHPNSSVIYTKISELTSVSKEERSQLYKDYKKKFDSELHEKLIPMYVEDQAARQPELNMDQMNILQKKHKKEIKDIIKRYGYPGYHCLSSSAVTPEGIPVDFTILFVHQKSSFKRKYVDMLHDGLLKGEIFPNEYAMIMDKIYLEEQGKSLYGYITHYPLLNPHKIDSIRKSIGLPKLGYEMWAFNTVFPNLSDKN
ncbi:hypothetical protein [Flavobacterium sp.]|uniref:hypothetical protein n=1 Tax=Flavobacterium sp. TaxID=239 RepID=UPI003D6BF5B6